VPLTLDLQFFAEEKTEKATPKKRQDEREKGKVAKSQDVNTAFLLLFAFAIIAVFASFMKEQMLSLYSSAFTKYIHWDITSETIMHIVFASISQLVKIALPVMIICIIAALAANLFQIGFLFTTEPLKFDLNKINPIQGAKRIFSLRALVELLKSFLKIIFIGSITFTIIWLNKDDIMMLSLKNVDAAVQFFGRTTVVMGISATLALLFLSILDYIYQRYDYEKNIRMSKQDIKDEQKNIEGDPLIKSKMKDRQRQMATQRMMSEVPEADVVITNPTHIAVALKYDELQASAPFIVAMGKDQIATKIIDIAKAHDVITVENKPLARSLYETLDIGDVIPEQFYQAVAEILAYVYRLENKV